jgi:hypothetical protein
MINSNLLVINAQGMNQYSEISMNDFLTIPPIPVNRSSQLRVSQMAKDFESAYASNYMDTISEVTIGVVKKDFIDPISGHVYKTGELYTLDGNTRAIWWQQNPQFSSLHIAPLSVRIKNLNDISDVMMYYKVENNSKSAKTTNHYIQGLLNRHNIHPQQSEFSYGRIATALKWAGDNSYNRYNNIDDSFLVHKDALVVLDGIAVNETKKNGEIKTYTITHPKCVGVRSQSIIASCLIALTLYPNESRIIEFIEKLISISEDDVKMACANSKTASLNQVEIIAAEYSKHSKSRAPSNSAQQWLGDGIAGTTTADSKMPQLNFVLAWIEDYLINPHATYSFKNGIRFNQWNDGCANFYKNVSKNKSIISLQKSGHNAIILSDKFFDNNVKELFDLP